MYAMRRGVYVRSFFIDHFTNVAFSSIQSKEKKSPTCSLGCYATCVMHPLNDAFTSFYSVFTVNAWSLIVSLVVNLKTNLIFFFIFEILWNQQRN